MDRGLGKASDRGVIANAMADDILLDLRPGLAQITTPLTLIYPDHVPVGAAKDTTDARYRGAYAAATTMNVVAAKDSLHFITFDQPAQLGAALDAFLAH